MNPLEWLAGWRTYIMGAVSIGTGVLLLLDSKFMEGFAAIAAGIGLLTGREAVRRVENKL